MKFELSENWTVTAADDDDFWAIGGGEEIAQDIDEYIWEGW